MPRSHCPECKYQLKWYENIPVLSYIFLKGKCSNCHIHIPLRYPIVETLVGLIGICFIAKVEHFAEYLFTLVIISVTVAMAFIDHKYHKLPHVLSYSAIIVSLLYISFWGSPYYSSLDGFSFLAKPLANLFSALSFYGLSIFSLDCFTHTMNQIYFRKKALRITPLALCFNNNFLTKNINYLYLVLTLLELVLIYSSPLVGFFVLNLILGISYLINEIVLEYFLKKNTEDEQEVSEEGSTVFGGGDAVLVSLIAIILGPVSALMILMAAFYIALVYFVILKIYSVVDKINKQEPSKYIPLGGALAVALIAAMIIL